MVILFMPLQLTKGNLCVQTFFTDNVPPEGWDGRAPQGSIIPPDFYSPGSNNSLLMNYNVVGNYQESVAASNQETEVRYRLSACWSLVG